MKFYGTIGYGETVEKAGVWSENITERSYYGEVMKNSYRMQNGEQLNDDVNINNRISILADPYAFANFHSIRYITWMDSKWKVTAVEVAYPRLILDIGGVYNG